MNDEKCKRLLQPFSEIYADNSVKEIMNKLNITLSEYRCIRDECAYNNLITLKKSHRPKRKKREFGKYYTHRLRNGILDGYVVTFKGKYIASCKTEEEAKTIVKYLKANEENYDLNIVKKIQEEIRGESA